MVAAVPVTITGGAGQISYSLIFRIASGALLGKDTPIALRLLEVPQALPTLNGVAMEIEDCAFGLIKEVQCTDNPEKAFADCQYAFLVGAMPRGPGMERADLLQANAKIFSSQGAAINEVADSNIRILVVGNPANTNALILIHNTPRINPKNISAMTRLDLNRATGAIATKTKQDVGAIKNIILWGNHSPSQYPDLHHATINQSEALAQVSEQWYRQEYIPMVQQRGAAVIKARGASSAASAANAAIDQMRDWALGTPTNDWTSMAVISDGSYGIAEDIVYSFPVLCKDGEWHIVQDLAINKYSQEMMQNSLAELEKEKSAIKHLL